MNLRKLKRIKTKTNGTRELLNDPYEYLKKSVNDEIDMVFAFMVERGFSKKEAISIGYMSPEYRIARDAARYWKYYK